MKILFTGGGTGGHFYPIIAVAEAVRDEAAERNLIDPTMTFYAPNPYNEKLLYDNQIVYRKISAGKVRRYASILNFFDLFKTAWGVFVGLWKVFWEYPDVIFSKGGYGSFPIVLAGRILGIPVMIHESDSHPGRVNLWAGKFAKKIAISYPEAAKYFPEGKTAWTGNPVRKNIGLVSREGAKEYLDLEENTPVIFILGGSQGSKLLNDTILDSLARLTEKYQIIHQTGVKNFDEVSRTGKILLKDTGRDHRYMPFKYMDDLAMRMSAGSADLVITRAGSTLFEVALWNVPSIVVPITDSNGDHQRKNAYTYAREGAGTVIEEKNLTDDILIAEIDRIFNDQEMYSNMKEATKDFAKPDAAHVIADELLDLGINHGK